MLVMRVVKGGGGGGIDHVSRKIKRVFHEEKISQFTIYRI